MSPRLVLDTNVLLDWHVFGDSRVQALVAQLRAQRWQWVTCPTIVLEWTRVAPALALARGLDLPDPSLVFEGAAPWVDPPPIAPALSLHCSDRDDQVFLDLAVASGAHALLTRDKALLRLARRAQRLHRLQIVRPEQFAASA